MGGHDARARECRIHSGRTKCLTRVRAQRKMQFWAKYCIGPQQAFNAHRSGEVGHIAQVFKVCDSHDEHAEHAIGAIDKC